MFGDFMEMKDSSFALRFPPEFLSETWLVLTQMGPYLLFGFLMAGILSVYINPEWVERQLGGRCMQ